MKKILTVLSIVVFMLFIVPVSAKVTVMENLATKFNASATIDSYESLLSKEMVASVEDGKLVSKVNINTASVEELKTLNGIGESKAKAIVEYRTVKGKFKNIEQIKEVNGISETIFTKIKDNITV